MLKCGETQVLSMYTRLLRIWGKLKTRYCCGVLVFPHPQLRISATTRFVSGAASGGDPRDGDGGVIGHCLSKNIDTIILSSVEHLKCGPSGMSWRYASQILGCVG